MCKYIKAVQFTLRHLSKRGRIRVSEECAGIGQHFWDAIVKQVGHDPIDLPQLPKVIVYKDKVKLKPESWRAKRAKARRARCKRDASQKTLPESCLVGTASRR